MDDVRRWLMMFDGNKRKIRVMECYAKSLICFTVCFFSSLTGNEFLERQGIKYNDLWDNIMALGVITLILLFLAYVQLRRIKKDK